MMMVTRFPLLLASWIAMVVSDPSSTSLPSKKVTSAEARPTVATRSPASSYMPLAAGDTAVPLPWTTLTDPRSTVSVAPKEICPRTVPACVMTTIATTAIRSDRKRYPDVRLRESVPTKTLPDDVHAAVRGRTIASQWVERQRGHGRHGTAATRIMTIESAWL